MYFILNFFLSVSYFLLPGGNQLSSFQTFIYLFIFWQNELNYLTHNICCMLHTTAEVYASVLLCVKLLHL